jgi:hypothetical protein
MNPGCTLPTDKILTPEEDEYIVCGVRVKEDTVQTGYTYHFAIEVCVAQWNEDPSNGNANADFAACKASEQHEGPDTPVLPKPGPTDH